MSKKGKGEEGPCVPPPTVKEGAKKASQPSPADEYANKLDMCLTDGVVKTGSGILLGAITSVFFFRKRRWPIITGMGIGIGLAWANCEHELNPPTAKSMNVPAKA